MKRLFLGVKMPEPWVQALDVVAAYNGENRSEVMRRFLMEGVERSATPALAAFAELSQPAEVAGFVRHVETGARNAESDLIALGSSGSKRGKTGSRKRSKG